MTAVAPYVPTYASRAPYLTAQEYVNAPTAVDTSNLVDGGTEQQNISELNTVIARASNVADTFCHQVLAATVALQSGLYRLRSGVITVPVDYTPLIAVTQVQVGWRVNQLTTLTDLSGVFFQRKTVSIPVGCLNYSGPAFPPAVVSPNGWVFAQVTYVNGYPNTTLTTTVQAGASSIELDDVTGIYPGSVLTIYDDFPGNEQITIASTYTAGDSTVLLVAPVQFQHSYGVSVSALPPAVKQAVILLTSSIIKTRGTLAIEMPSLQSSPSKIVQQDQGAMSDEQAAKTLLAPYVRVA